MFAFDLFAEPAPPFAIGFVAWGVFRMAIGFAVVDGLLLVVLLGWGVLRTAIGLAPVEPGVFFTWMRLGLLGSLGRVFSLARFALGGTEFSRARSSSVKTLVNFVMREAGFGELCLTCAGDTGLDP